MDSGLLYGDMLASFLFHLAGPIAFVTLFSGLLSSYPLTTRVWIVIIATVLFSFIVNFCALLFLQTTSCGGLKDAGGIAKGAVIGAALTGLFMWLPSIWEGLRLAISQVAIEHKSLLTPLEAAQDRVIVPASQQLLAVSAPPETPIQTGGKRLTPEEYADQTFSEIKTAMAYMAAFAGAYGVGIGSRYAVNCKA